MKFADQYKHPKWQQKRMEAFAEVKAYHGELCCQRCGDTESQLQVHHKRYVKDRMIWEYQTSELEVLCNDCHQTAHMEKDSLHEFLSRFSTEAMPEFIALLAGYSSVINGAAGAAKVDDILIQSEEHFAIESGMIAAILSNRLTVSSIFELRQLIKSTSSGDYFTFQIPIKKRFEDF